MSSSWVSKLALLGLGRNGALHELLANAAKSIEANQAWFLTASSVSSRLARSGSIRLVTYSLHVWLSVLLPIDWSSAPSRAGTFLDMPSAHYVADTCTHARMTDARMTDTKVLCCAPCEQLEKGDAERKPVKIKPIPFPVESFRRPARKHICGGRTKLE